MTFLKLLDRLMGTTPASSPPETDEERPLNDARVRAAKVHDELAEADALVTFAETLWRAHGGHLVEDDGR